MKTAGLLKRIDAYERLIRLDKPIGTLLLLWPTLWAVWIAAKGRPSLDLVVIFGVGTFLMRSAGCAINDYADRNFDGRVERTRLRPLAAGEISPNEALAVGAVLAAIAFGFVLFLNRFAILLSVPALAIACSYPYVKRVFALPQLYLGVAFGFGIPMAFAATLNGLPWECWALLAANICYAFAYDTEYAMVDRDDDLKIGIRTSAITLGRHDVAAVMASYALMLALLVWAGDAIAQLGYKAGTVWFLVLFVGGWALQLWGHVYEGRMAYHYMLIRGRSRDGCFRAFRHNNWVGLAVFAGIVLSYPPFFSNP